MTTAQTRPLLVALAIALAVALLATPLAGVDASPPTEDEFVVGYDARRIVAGEIPFRDFHAVEPPAGILLHAALYRVVGPSQLASRLVALWLGALGALLAFVVVSRAGGTRLAAAIAAVASAAPLWLWPYPTPHGAALVVALAALATALAGRFAVAGALVATAGLFYPAVGVAAAVGVAVLAAHGRTRAIWLHALAGAALVVAALALWLAAHGALASAARALAWPLSHYNRARGFNDVGFAAGLGRTVSATRAAAGPVAAAACVLVGFTVAALALVGPALLLPAAAIARRRRGPAAATELALAAAGATLTLLALVQRPDIVHLGFAAALIIPAAACRRSPLIGRLAMALTYGAAVGVAVLAVTRALAAPLPPRFDTVVARWPAVVDIRAVTRDGDRIAVLPAGGFYYAYARPAAIGYSWLLPPRARYHDASDYDRVADELAGARAVFFTSLDDERDFAEHAGRLSAVLARDFHPVVTPAGSRAWLRR